MKIRELFLRDINRHINPAVTVDSFNTDTINAEISEYIFTDELIENLYKFLHTLFFKEKGKTGVWINGYYGSGKSHFIKFAHYCMANEHTVAAFEHYVKAVKNYGNDFSDVTLANVDRLKKQIVNSKTETIIFNVEAVATNSKSKKERLTEIFLKQLNRHRGYNAVNIPVALYLEKSLDKQGKFNDFKKRISQKFHQAWDFNANDLISLKLKAVLELAKQVDDEIDVEALRNQISKNEDINIKDTLIPELVDYLQDKPDDFRLIFMVDEISQFIGNDISLLLNLQTIVEAIEEPCKRRVWLVTTAQQALEDVVSVIKSSNIVTDEDAVGKILGRFETRISLESKNADYITQKRVLDKKPESLPELEYFYGKNKEDISNKFNFLHNSYKSYSNEDNFKLAYPFIPYQFKLIADVFDAFSSAGYVIKEVKDNERSVLGITHKTVKLFAEKEIGDFVPFDAFFNETFKANLTHKARKMLQPALDAAYIQSNKFAQRVVYALFMIANISSVDKQKFSSNIDNLLILLITRLSENRNELQANIQKVLAQLMKENIIYEEDGNYFFYKEEEMDIATAIKNISPSLDDRYTYFYDILKNLLKNDSKTIFNSSTLSLKFFLDDKAMNQKGDMEVKFTVFAQKGMANMAMSNSERNLIFALNEWFSDDKQLFNDFINYVKTAMYIAQNNKDGSSEHKKTIEKFSERNQKAKEAIANIIKNCFHETPLVSGNQIIKAEEIIGTTADRRYKRALEMHFERVYKYNKLADNYAQTSDKLKRNQSDTQTSFDKELTEAEQRIVRQMELNGGEILLSDLITVFFAPPFGWKDIAIIDMIRILVNKKAINISYRNEDRMRLSNFVVKALKSQERKVIKIKPGDKISQDEVNKIISVSNNIFNTNLKSFTDAHNLADELKDIIIGKIINPYKKSFKEHAKWPFFTTINQIKTEFEKLIDKRDIKRFFSALIEHENHYREIYDKYMELNDFVKDNIKDYEEINLFVNLYKDDFKTIGNSTAEKYDWINEFYIADEYPVDNFRKLKKKYNELKNERKEAIEKHRSEYKNVYANVLVTLQKELKNLELDEKLLDNCKAKIKEIEKLENITRIRLEISKASEYYAKYLEDLVSEKSKINSQKSEEEKAKKKAEQVEQPKPYKTKDEQDNPKREEQVEEVPPKKSSTRYSIKKSASSQLIKNKQDIDTYVEKLREDLTKLLNEAETIILE